MENWFKRVESLLMLIVLVSVLNLCTPHEKQVKLPPSDQEPRTLIVTSEGRLERVIDATGWEIGEEAVSLHTGYGWGYFYYPWLGEDSIDYSYKDHLLWVNGKLVGADLSRVEISDLPSLEDIVVISGYHIAPEKLKRFPNLVAVHLSFSLDSTLRKLEALPKGLQLYVSCSYITDLGLIRLSRFPNIKVLEIGMCRIGFGLRYLRNLKNLQVLLFGGMNLSNRGLKYISHVNSLRELRIYGHGWPAWEVFHIFVPLITGQGFKQLAKLENLEVLALSRICGTEKAFAQLEGLSGLRELYLYGIGICVDSGFAFLEGLSELRKLYCFQINIESSDLAYIKDLTNLRILELLETNVDDSGLKYLVGLKNLEILNLRSTKCSQMAFDSLQKALPKCRIIHR